MKAKGNFTKYLKRDRFRVTIFGSARIKENDQTYKQIFELAKMLGERGIDVVTGGGPGIMKAGNTGHNLGSKETKAKSVGLKIKLPHEQRTNVGVQVEKRFKRFSNRIDNFMLLSNAVVVAPGGVGTLLELFYTWQVLQVKNVCNIPIILMGDHWDGLVDWLKKRPLKKKYFTSKDLKLIFQAKNHKEIIKIIDAVHENYKTDKNFCINCKKHKVC